MKLGILTASLSTLHAEAVIARAGAMGLDAVELAAWPLPLERPGTAAHIETDGSIAASTDRLRHLLDEHGVEVSALAYYDNVFDPENAARVRAHLNQVIDVAGDLGCPLVGTFIGRDPRLTIEDNLKAAEDVFASFVEHAGQRGVRLMIENCPMQGWHLDGYPGNLAYSPELWEWLETLGLWLNYDPSHLPQLGIDPVDALKRHVHRVVHVHAKDVVISRSARNRLSCFGQVVSRQNRWDTGWWSYRLPGNGELDWPQLIATLSGSFEGVISIEHEDEEKPSTPESILADVEQAALFLRQLTDR